MNIIVSRSHEHLLQQATAKCFDCSKVLLDQSIHVLMNFKHPNFHSNFNKVKTQLMQFKTHKPIRNTAMLKVLKKHKDLMEQQQQNHRNMQQPGKEFTLYYFSTSFV